MFLESGLAFLTNGFNQSNVPTTILVEIKELWAQKFELVSTSFIMISENLMDSEKALMLEDLLSSSCTSLKSECSDDAGVVMRMIEGQEATTGHILACYK